MQQPNTVILLVVSVFIRNIGNFCFIRAYEHEFDSEKKYHFYPIIII